MRPEVVDLCEHCGHARTSHYFPPEREPVALLVKPGTCLHRDAGNGPRCPCSQYIAQSTLDISESRA